MSDKVSPYNMLLADSLKPQEQPRQNPLLGLWNALNQTQTQYGLDSMARRVYDPNTGQYGGLAGLLDMPANTLLSDMGRSSQAQRQAIQSGAPMRDAYMAGFNNGGEDVANALNFVGNIKAYHGSPHSFDRFDMSKIGTGEGAQAYGHGLYFAENPSVASDYRNRLSQSSGGTDQIAQTLADQAGGNWNKALQKFESELLARAQKLRDAGSPSELPAYDIEVLKALRKGQPGSMYEVNIKAKPEDFLDWDKPLSQQSEKVRASIFSDIDSAIETTRNALSSASPRRAPTTTAELERLLRERARLESLSGGDYYRQSSLGVNSGQPLATGELQGQGIPGIKYLDQGSRTAGEGSRNYVVFDDKLVEILKKYGIAGLGLTGLLGAAGGKDEGGI